MTHCANLFYHLQRQKHTNISDKYNSPTTWSCTYRTLFILFALFSSIFARHPPSVSRLSVCSSPLFMHRVQLQHLDTSTFYCMIWSSSSLIQLISTLCNFRNIKSITPSLRYQIRSKPKKISKKHIHPSSGY